MLKLFKASTFLLLFTANLHASGDLVVTGNAGIGSTPPAAKLHVVPAPGGISALFTDVDNSSLRIQHQSPNVVRLDVDADEKLIVSRGGKQSLTLNSSGNLGVGIEPATWKFAVNGTAASYGWAQFSDSRLKKSIQPIANPLAKVFNLQGVSFEWGSDDFKDRNFPEGRHFGVIAQQVEQVLPEVTKTDQDGIKSVAYIELVPVLIEAVKEQQKQIEALRKRLEGMR